MNLLFRRLKHAGQAFKNNRIGAKLALKVRRFVPPALLQAVSYVFFGALTTLVNWGIYFAGTAALRPEQYRGTPTHALLLNLINIAAWALSVLFAYATNKRYVFGSRAEKLSALRELGLFVSARVASYLLFDLALYNLMVFGMGLAHGWVKILMNVLVVAFNYFASKFVIFKKGKAG